MGAFICEVVNAEETLAKLRADRRRNIYECYDGTFAIDHQGGVISKGTIDDLEKRGLIKRRWPDQPNLNCWTLA